ncbi:MAG: arsenic efflux protein [Clostridiales bacterium]|jgi:hypothetical protein|nr:arsenic efflux protein [Clostridiales bacterium]
MLEIFLDVLTDSLKILPFLFVAYIFTEYMERKTNFAKALADSGLGSIPGAFLGLIPQCGFTPAASNMYASGFISIGTLLAVFISTSDEALIILISTPGHFLDVLALIAGKLVIAVVVGFVVDIFSKKIIKKGASKAIFHDKQNCKCCKENMFVAALKHTMVVFLYIFVSFFVFETLIYVIGEEKVASILLKGNFFQPFVTALFGFVPSCASSVLLTNLYVEGTLSFASVLSGLITNSGIGLLILFKVNKNVAQNLKIMGLLYLTAVSSGIILGFFI